MSMKKELGGTQLRDDLGVKGIIFKCLMTVLGKEECGCSTSLDLGPMGRICWDLELGLLVRGA